MKLTSVELYSVNSFNNCVLSFRDPTSQNPYQVKSILGLDADEIVNKYYGSGGGSNFYHMSLKKRDIVVRIGLNPDFSDSESYSDLRDELYRVIAGSRNGKVQLRFKNLAQTVAATSGFIKKFESSHFTQTPEVQMTIECDDPMLRAVDPITIPEEDIVVESQNSDSYSILMDNMSTAPHGFKLLAQFTSNTPDFFIGAPQSEWIFSVAPSQNIITGFLSGDVLYLSSEIDKKELYVVRGGTTYHLADGINFGSVWPVMFPGQNHFIYSSELDLKVVTYLPTYWGV